MKKAYWAELFGTLFLVLAGTGAAVIAGNILGRLGGSDVLALFDNLNKVLNVGVAFAFGLTLAALIYSLGHISGGHFNPAVTLGAWLSKRISGKEAWAYVLFQVIGAILGSFVLYLIISNFFAIRVTAVGQNAYIPSIWMVSALAEIVFTAFFVMVILGATSAKANVKFAGLAIGLALVVIHIVLIPVTGTSVNPARSIGPAIFSAIGGNAAAIPQLALFILAPLAGGGIGALIWKLVSNEEKAA